MPTFTNKQKDNVQSFIERVGLSPDFHWQRSELLRMAQLEKNNLIFSDNPLESAIPPFHVPAADISELKRLIGSDNRSYDAHINYPPPLPMSSRPRFRTALAEEVDDEFLNEVRTASAAYLYGDPGKVMEYEPVINSLMFPLKITVFTGQDLNIPAGEVYTIKGEGIIVLNFEEITVGKGAEIKITTGTIINTQYITQL